MPPSAIILTFLYLFKPFLTFEIAENCGYPIPATTLVVQIDPGPMPTFTASTFNFASSIAACSVAILPAIKVILLLSFLICLTISITA